MNLRQLKTWLDDKHAVRITTTGEMNIEVPENGKKFTLKELYKHTGADIVEMVRLSFGRIMWLHEEGKILGLPENWLATAAAQPFIRPDDFIVGDVLITCKGQVD